MRGGPQKIQFPITASCHWSIPSAQTHNKKLFMFICVCVWRKGVFWQDWALQKGLLEPVIWQVLFCVPFLVSFSLSPSCTDKNLSVCLLTWMRRGRTLLIEQTQPTPSFRWLPKWTLHCGFENNIYFYSLSLSVPTHSFILTLNNFPFISSR